tara:strand:+ start:70 stop:417 length:348 start_codon:yes stop_codon:yes gene_type:complete
MELMELRGTIYKIDQAKEVGNKGFKIREFVVHEHHEKFPNYYAIQMTGDDVDKLENFSELEKVSCKIAVNGRKWVSPENQEKFFNTFKCISIAQDLTEVTITPEENTRVEEDLPF